MNAREEVVEKKEEVERGDPTTILSLGRCGRGPETRVHGKGVRKVMVI